MQLFVYEFISGGGPRTLAGSGPLSPSLLNEGRAMLAALLEDIAALDGPHAVAMWDQSLGLPPSADRLWPVRSAAEHVRTFARLAADSDWTLLIAPEFDGILHSVCRSAETSGARLLSPGSDFIALTSDKNLTAEVLQTARLPVPSRLPLGALPGSREADFPLVLKPADGAGSLDLYRLNSADDLPGEMRKLLDEELRRCCTAVHIPERPSRWRLERWVPGTAVSVGLLNGPNRSVTLPACRQFLSNDARLRYRGGATPLDPRSDRRARRLAAAAVAALPQAVGFVGVDLVLGDDPRGSQDVIVEVNPRLTTSYVGLRKSLAINLVEAMRRTALGEEVELPTGGRPVQFEPDGTVHWSG